MAASPTAPTPEPIEIRKPLSTGQRTLLGCALGCFGLVAVTVTVLAFGWWWASTPGPQVATEPIVPDDAVAAIRIEGLAEDPGFLELVDAAIAEYQEASRRELEEVQKSLPGPVRWMTGFRSDRRPRPEELQRWLPREVTLFVEAAPESPDGYSVVAAVNLARYPRVLRFVLLSVLGREQDGRRYAYRGQPIRIEDDTAVAFLGSTLLIGNDATSLEGAIDGVLDAGSPARGVEAPLGGVDTVHRIGTLARRHPGEWDVHGGFENRENVLARLWWDVFDVESEGRDEPRPTLEEDPPPQTSWDTPEDPAEPPVDPELEALAVGVEATWLGIDLVSADEIYMVLSFRARDEQAARQWARRVESDLDRARSEAEKDGLDLIVETELAGPVVDVRLQARGVRQSIRRAMEKTVEDAAGDKSRETPTND